MTKYIRTSEPKEKKLDESLYRSFDMGNKMQLSGQSLRCPCAVGGKSGKECPISSPQPVTQQVGGFLC